MKIRVATTVQKESFMFQMGLALKSAMEQSLETVTCAFLRRRRQCRVIKNSASAREDWCL